ncbi:Chromosome segregation ATPase Smc (Smc) [Fructobacillus tropaeoli]|nr:Chromosome segregation ATPase Smc (Smc) [Fructobacillus tropaeoli]
MKNKILADTGLTSATQQSQSSQVDADLTKALAAVGQAKDDDDVTQAVATWTGTLNADYQAGQTLSVQQTTAKNALSTLAGQVKAKITADTGLTQAQQQSQSGQVDADLAKGQAAVSGATDADDVNNTVNIWTPTLNGDYQAGQALSTQQESANQNLAVLAGQIKAKINGDTGLTQAQQQTQADLVDSDLGKVKAAVTAATNADGVNSAVSAWTQTLNNDYTAGQALSTQQATANTNLQVLAAQVKAQIATDTGLTGAQQKSAAANVANDLTQAQSAVSAATNDDGLNSAVSAWTERLHSDYQAGETLAAQQQTAQTNFSTLAGQVKAKITADTGLTSAQKQAEEGNVTADLGKAQAVVAAATNADGVNNAVSTWTQTLNGDYQAGQALTDQQKAASQQLSTLAGQVNNQIKADTGLTDAAQQTDEDNVAADLAKGQGAVSAAVDADGVNSAVATWTQTLNNDYKAGEALKDQQATANSNLAALAGQVNAKILADTGLTSATQQSQSNQLSTDLTKAQGVVSAATNADGVNGAVAIWTQTLNNDYTAGEPLKNQQDTATGNLATLADQVKAKITADTGLTSAAQQAQSSQVSNDLTKAQAAITAATNADGVNNAVSTWTQTLNSDYQAGEALSNQQNTASGNLATLASQVKAKISADTGLTAAAQQAQSGRVTTDLTKAQAAVTAATNADGVNSAVATWTQALNNDYTAGEALSAQQLTANGNLGKVASQVKATISAGTGLTAAAQQAQFAQVDADLAKAQAAVTAATNADGVNSAVATWTGTLNGDYKAGEALSTQQTTANGQLAAVANQVKAAISADTGLTGDQQQAEIANLNTDLTKAQSAVNATTNADGVNSAAATWTATLNNDHKVGQVLSAEQMAANTNLAVLAGQVKNQILTDTGLTAATRRDQSAQVDADLTKAQAAVSAATNDDGVNSAVSTWTPTLSGDYKAGQTLSDQQTAATTTLSTLADQIKAKITADTGLTGVAQQAQENQLANDLTNAKTAINGTTNADGVNSAVATWKQTLTNDYQAGVPLSTQQSNATASLSMLAGQVKAKILADTGLTGSAQQAQSAQLATDLTKAQSAVNSATNADGVNSTIASWTQTFNNDYTAGEPLSAQQSAKNNDLATLAGQVKAKIFADTGLTGAAQQAQSNQVTLDLAKAQAAVSGATNADGVNGAVATWTQTLNNDYTAGQALSTQQSTANNNLATLAGQVKTKIQADTGLTGAAQQAQSKQVDQDLEKAQDAVTAAKNADGVNSAVSTWTQTLNADYQAGEPLTTQQATAVGNLGTLASQLKTKILADTGLTSAAQQAQSNQIDQDLAKAQSVVNTAASADGVNSAVSTWTQTLNADYKAGEALTAQQSTANSNLSTLADQVKAKIQADTGLTGATQQAQSAQVTQDLAKAQAAVSAAVNADGVNSAASTWTQTLNGDYQAGQALATQQATANNNLSTLADQVKGKIQADTGLTGATEQSQLAQVGNDLAKAQAAVSAATDADGVNSAVTTWTQTLNHDYQAGQALSAQQLTANTNLATLADQAKAKISADTGLTGAAQQTQSNQVETDLAKAQAAVTAATNADGVNSAVSTWTQTLNTDYQAGQALSAQQSAANTNLATLAGQVKAKILADTGLTSAAQQAQSNQVDADLAKAQTAVNGATTADGVNSAVSTWTQTLNHDYQAGQALSDQQSAANTNLATLAGQVKAKIQADTGLTSAAQQSQSNQVDQDLAKAQAAVTDATNADGVNSAVSTWTQTVTGDYKAGQALSAQQSAANTNLATLAGQVKAKIQADTGLTAVAQQSQSKQVDRDLAQAQTAVKNADNADGVNSAVATWTHTLNGDYQAGQALADQQKAANQQLSTLAGQITNQIDGDTGLTGANQQSESANVNADLAKAQTAVSGATNADGVNSAVSTWTQTLKADYKAGETLTAEQKDANSQLSILAVQIKNQILSDSGLTSSQQQSQSNQVDTDLGNALTAVRASTDDDDVNSVVTSWTKTLNGDYKAGEALTAQQATASGNLATLADQVKTKIQADTGLTNAQQVAQSGQVDTDLTQAKAAVTAATNADGLNSVVSTWTQTINGDYKAGEALSAQETTASDNLATLAGQVKAKIQADTGLTAVAQQAQVNQVGTDLTQAQAAVTAAKNADGLNSVVASWTQTLTDDYKAGEALLTQQSAANTSLATLAGQIKGKIQADTGLTTADQQSQSSQLDQDLAKAQAAVNAATNADGVNSTMATWTQTLNGDYKAGQALSAQQSAANTNLATLAGQIKGKVMADTGLTSAQQTNQSGQVASDLTKAQAAVDAATNADGVNGTVATWTQTLNNDYQAGQALSTQQSNASDSLATLAGQVKAKVEDDTGLTAAAQQSQSSQVEADLAKAQAAVDAASNADVVNSAVSTWMQTLNGDYKAGQALAAQQLTASGSLTTLAGQVKAKVAADTGLTSAAQQAQSSQVDGDLTKAQAAIDTATNADGVNTAVATWMKTLNGDYQAGESLADQQSAATGSLATLAGQVKAKIEADTGLTGAAQQAQSAQVDQDLTKAQTAVNAATNADGVNGTVSSWTKTLNGDYQAGEDLADQQSAANTNLATLAGQVKAKITADTGLTGVAQQAQTAQVDNDLAKAQAAVNAATNADGVNSAVSTWTKTLNADYQAGEALSSQQSTANTNLATLTNQVKAKITADTGLTGATQQAQSKQVAIDLAKAQAAVNAAGNADNVNSVVSTWTKTLNADYQAGEALSSQQATATNNLATLAGQVKAKIEADTGLTGTQQQAESGQVDQDLAKAQSAVNAATNADGVNAVVATWTQTINGDYRVGEALSDEQKDASSKLSTLAVQIKNEILADTGLTSATQKSQSNQVDTDLGKALTAVSAAKDDDGVNSVVASWTQTLSGDYKAGEALSAQQSTAANNLATLAIQVKAKVEADTGLTVAAQQAQEDQVARDLSQAQNGINGATNADGVNSIAAIWTQTLNGDYKAGEALSSQQATATNNLATLAGQVKGKIEADTGLTGAVQQAQSNQVATDLGKAQAAVNAASNADGVNSAVTSWTQTLNADYKAGEALSAQQVTANSGLVTLAGQMKAKIAGDAGLTGVAQQNQTNQVDQDLTKAQAAVNAATNADGVNSDVTTWTQTLNADYQAGEALSTQQATAGNTLATLAGQVKAKITADTGLTGTQQQTESNQVDADLAKAQSAINAATNADGVNAAVSTWTQTLNGDYRAGEALSDEQKDAGTKLSTLALQTKNEILSDTGLTSAQQQAQSNQIDSDLSKALTAVGTAKDDDDVNSALATWTQTLNGDYKLGEALSTQQSTASASLTTLAGQVKAKITADTGLTGVAQQTQSAQVENDLTKAQAAVKSATNADGVNSAESAWTQTLNANYQAGEALSAQQSAATASLATLADQVKAKITADTGLTGVAQQAQVNQVENDLTKAQAAVNATTNADGVNTVVSTWTQTLNADYHVGQALSTQQTAAGNTLATLAGQVKAKITADTGLTSAAQSTQSNQLAIDLAKAQAAVNAATNADGVNSTVSAWTQTLNGDYQAGEALSAQQSTAANNLATLAGQVKAKIQADNGLTGTQQQTESGQVDQDLAKAQGAVNAASNADGVNAVVTTWTQTLNGDYRTGEALSDEQKDAGTKLSTLVVQIKNKILSDTGLTVAAQKAQLNQVDTDLGNALTAVSATKDDDDVNSVVATWTQTLNGDYKAGEALSAQQSAATGSLATLASQVKAKIATDTGLTAAAQQAQSAQVENDLTKAQAAVTVATNADGVNSAVTAWTQTLNSDYQAGEALSMQQSAATNNLSTLASQVKAKIAADTGLTGAAQQAQSNQVETDLGKAQAAVNAATNADGVNSAATAWIQTLTSDYQVGQALSAQQLTANSSLAALAGQVKAQIKSDTGLTSAAQATQASQVDTDLVQAQAVISAATNADGVNSAVSTWTKTLKADYQAGTALSTQQTNAGNNLVILAGQVKAKIVADTGLTAVTQQTQSNQVEDDLTKAQAAVNATTNADGVNSVVAAWTQTLNADYRAGEALATQQSTANGSLAILAGQLKAAIKADTGLTGAAQQAQSNQVDADLAKAQAAVTATSNADGVNSAVATWTQTLNGDYQAGEALSNQQKTAGGNLATLADQIKAKITADTGLTSVAQQAESSQVETDLAKAQASVNATTNSDGVNSAVSTWTQTLNGDYRAGEALVNQQQTANNALSTLANQVQAKIQADTGLTSAEQQTQSSQVASDLAKAQSAVGLTTNADGVNHAVASWTEILDGDYKTGKTLSAQQLTANSNLATLAGQVKAKIAADTGLTGASRQAQSNQVETDLAQAQGAVTAATNADGVNSAVSTWMQTLNADYKAGEALATQQATANTNLTTLANQVKGKIQADTGLTSASQQSEASQVNADLAKAQDAVNAATNADGVNSAVSTWTQSLNADYQAGEALTAEQKDANTKLSALSVQVKNEILTDTGLTSATQQIQLNQVDHDLGQALAAIGTSKDDDEVNTVVSAWTQTLNGDYKAGEALPNQQETATAALTTLAGQVKAKILADTGLTSVDQQSQANQVAKDSTQAQAAVNAATNADGVNSAVTIWTATLNGDYQAGEALATQQASANGQLLTLAGQMKAKILADTGLTTVQQQNQSNQVDRDLTQAQAAVTAATNADGVNSAVATWTKTLNGDYQAGEALAVQQTIANANLATLANQVKVKIEADAGLTSDQKQAQSERVDADLDRAQSAVNATTNADGVDNEVSTWTKTLNADYQAGEPLPTQQSTANGQMTTLANQVKAKVEADTGLTSAEQQNQSAQVDRDLAQSQGAINTTTNADGVKNAIATWTQILSADYQAGETLSAQQSTANSNLATLASQVQAKIAADTGLTTAEQRVQSGQVNADLAQAQGVVNAAQNADAVNGAVATWIKTLNDDYKPGEVLSAQQSTATSNLEILAYQMKAKIAADTGLTGVEQHTQSAQVDTDLAKAEAVVSAATNADGLKNAIAVWTPTLTGDYHAGESLSAQQESAKSNLATLADQEAAKVAADTGLTSAEQQVQSGQVEADLAKAQAAVTAATNADGVNSAVATWTQTLTGDYHAGQPLSTQQATANSNLNGLAGQVRAKILADTGLTSTAQQAQVTQVNQDLAKAQNTVSAATNADGVNSAVATWTQTLTGDYKAGQALSNQQVTATNQLADLANQVKAKIAGDAGLTSADHQAQSAQVENDLTKAEAVVTAATNADGLDNAVNTWTKTLNGDYTAGQAVAAQQAIANDNLAVLASQVQAKIAADTGLTNAEKQAQSSHVEADLTKAETAVNAATNADGINSAASIWQQTLNHDYQEGAPLSSEQTAANTSLATLAGQVKAKILADTGLTTAQQQAQENQVNLDLAKAQSAVNQAKDDDGVNNAVTIGTQALNADYQAGKALAQQQQDADANLAAVANQVKAKIATDTGLTSVEKQSQSGQVDTDLSKANSAVNAATNADSVNSAVSTWTQTLNGDYHAGVSLDSQKAAAGQAIATAATSARAAIVADKTLTTAQKQAQEIQVDQDQAKAQAAINAATDADATDTARDAGAQTMANDHQPGASVADQQAAANQAVAANAAAAKAAIEADKTLTTAQKQAQESQVDQDQAKAQAAINAATDADAINTARDAGNQTMTNDHQPGASVADQQATANQAVATNAAAAKAAIKADKTLTTAQKQVQESQVDQDAAKAQEAINAATDADETNAARNTGTQAMTSDHQPGASIADQKAAANQAVATKATAAKAAIEADKTLTTAQKQAQDQQIDQDEAKAQAAINAATDADETNAAREAGNQTVVNDHQPGASIADQKAAANQAVANKAAAIKAAIEADKSLTTAQKQAEENRVDQAVTKAQAAINAATDADAMNTARDAGNQVVVNDHQPGTSITDQKSAADQAVAAKAAAAKAAIEADNSLTTAQKQAEENQVDQALAKAQAAINAATDADGIQTNLATYDQQLQKLQDSLTKLTSQESAHPKQSVAEKSAGVATQSVMTVQQDDRETERVTISPQLQVVLPLTGKMDLNSSKTKNHAQPTTRVTLFAYPKFGFHQNNQSIIKGVIFGLLSISSLLAMTKTYFALDFHRKFIAGKRRKR